MSGCVATAVHDHVLRCTMSYCCCNRCAPSTTTPFSLCRVRCVAARLGLALGLDSALPPTRETRGSHRATAWLQRSFAPSIVCRRCRVCRRSVDRDPRCEQRAVGVRQHRPRRRLRLRAGAGLVGPACCAVSSAMRLRATIPRGSWRRGMHAPQKCMHPHAHMLGTQFGACRSAARLRTAYRSASPMSSARAASGGAPSRR